MKNLLKKYGFANEMEYFEMIVMSVVNGQRVQARTQFMAMPKDERKNFIKALNREWHLELDKLDREMFIDLL